VKRITTPSKRTEPRPKATRTVHLVEFGHVVPQTVTYVRTDVQTDMLIAILRCPTGG